MNSACTRRLSAQYFLPQLLHPSTLPSFLPRWVPSSFIHAYFLPTPSFCACWDDADSTNTGRPPQEYGGVGRFANSWNHDWTNSKSKGTTYYNVEWWLKSPVLKLDSLYAYCTNIHPRAGSWRSARVRGISPEGTVTSSHFLSRSDCVHTNAGYLNLSKPQAAHASTMTDIPSNQPPESSVWSIEDHLWASIDSPRRSGDGENHHTEEINRPAFQGNWPLFIDKLQSDNNGNDTDVNPASSDEDLYFDKDV